MKTLSKNGKFYLNLKLTKILNFKQAFKFTGYIRNKGYKVSPENSTFYGKFYLLGLPISQTVPNTKKELTDNFKFLNTIEDMIDIHNSASHMFSGEVMEAFLEQLRKVKNKELRKVYKKDSNGNFLSEDNSTRKEINEKMTIFLNDLDKFSLKQKYSFSELNLVIFQFLYRFDRKVDEYLVKKYFHHCKEIENFKDFSVPQLIKSSYILSRYYIYNENLKEDAQIGLYNITMKFLQKDLSLLSREEITLLLQNMAHREIFADLELFLKLEPYILKHMKTFNMKILFSVYHSYLNTYNGSKFFIQTMSFYIRSMIKQIEKKGYTI